MPPSACSTSQSIRICRSPRASRSITLRRARPISRWISCVRPDWRPFAASRLTRSGEDPGRSEYSAVTQPRPVPRIHLGTSSSTEAVHRTFVRPETASTEPAANSVKSRTKKPGRSSSRARPSWRARSTRDELACRSLRQGTPGPRAQGRGRRSLEVDDPSCPFDDHVQVIGPSSGREVFPPSVGSRRTRWFPARSTSAHLTAPASAAPDEMPAKMPRSAEPACPLDRVPRPDDRLAVEQLLARLARGRSAGCSRRRGCEDPRPSRPSVARPPTPARPDFAPSRSARRPSSVPLVPSPATKCVISGQSRQISGPVPS